MTVPENTYTTILIAAIVILFTLYIVGLIKSLRAGSTGRRAAIPALTLAFLLLVYLAFNLREIRPTDWAQIVLLFGLVVVTGVYALSTARQADASVKMAEEMREQRIVSSRPVIIQKAVPVQAIGKGFSDNFEIYNAGNGPAIELEIFLLDEEKKLLSSQKETFVRAGGTPIEFHPTGLGSHLNSICYLLCQYQSVIALETNKVWYQTWLPFNPIKSQSRDYIYAQPKELEFREVFEKESY